MTLPSAGQTVVIGQSNPVRFWTSSTRTRAAICSAGGKVPERVTTVDLVRAKFSAALAFDERTKPGRRIAVTTNK